MNNDNNISIVCGKLANTIHYKNAMYWMTLQNDNANIVNTKL